ncbi:hypothetical protein [Flavobacterium sp. ZB4P13]|uniref:bestrophin-like domain n=1 Tax=Flavobacterium sp. ZB4P13 TaxID=3401728 RepID=UPI003AADF694
MNQSLLYQTPTWIIAALLFLSMIIIYCIGYMIRKAEIKRNKTLSNEGLGSIEASLLGLLALLLSFTFSMSATRYDNRRTVIIDEANNIGTAVLRADMYPESIKKLLKADFKDYLEARIEYYNAGVDSSKINLAIKKTEFIYTKIWNQVMKESQKPENLVRSNQMIPALNNMIDIVTTRDAIKNATVPNSVFGLLFLIILFASFTVGYSNIKKQKNHILALAFSFTVVATVCLILDLDRPRRGVIDMNTSEHKIVELRNLFKE